MIDPGFGAEKNPEVDHFHLALVGLLPEPAVERFVIDTFFSKVDYSIAVGIDGIRKPPVAIHDETCVIR